MSAARRHVAPARFLLLIASIVAFLATGTSAASATTFGYGDNKPAMFDDARWQALPLKDSRRTVDWDVSTDAAKTADLDGWMAAAQRAGSTPLLAIDRSWTPGKGNSKPTAAQYRELISWLRARYPWWNTLTPWNEANFRLQPTYKNPALAWSYWKAAKKACTGCTVTSPVILTGKGTNKKWLSAFLKLSGNKIKLWAVHNYGDQNRRTDSSLKAIERQVKGRIWLTEAAGWVKFAGSWPYDEVRAARVLDFIFSSARKHARVDRVYFWEWRGSTTAGAEARWDSGVLNADGSERFGFGALKKGLGVN